MLVRPGNVQALISIIVVIIVVTIIMIIVIAMKACSIIIVVTTATMIIMIMIIMILIVVVSFPYIRHGRCCGNTETVKQRNTETINGEFAVDRLG